MSFLNTGTSVLFRFFSLFCTRRYLPQVLLTLTGCPTTAGLAALHNGLVPINLELGTCGFVLINSELGTCFVPSGCRQSAAPCPSSLRRGKTNRHSRPPVAAGKARSRSGAFWWSLIHRRSPLGRQRRALSPTAVIPRGARPRLAPAAAPQGPLAASRGASAAGPLGTGPSSPGVSQGPAAKPPHRACPSTAHVGSVFAARARPWEL